MKFKIYLLQIAFILLGLIIGYDLFISYYFLIIQPPTTDAGYIDYVLIFSFIQSLSLLLPLWIFFQLITSHHYFRKIKFNKIYALIPSIIIGFLYPLTQKINLNFLGNNVSILIVIQLIVGFFVYFLILLFLAFIFNKYKWHD